MKRSKFIPILAALLMGCATAANPAGEQEPPDFSATQTPALAPEATPAPAPTAVPVPTTPPIRDNVPLAELDLQGVEPYEAGRIMVLMYHGIVPDKVPKPYQRSAEDFKKDLQALYDGGYRLMPMSDLLDNNISVAAGYTPVVICFDDGLSTSFSLAEQNGELMPAPDCGVDILEKFAGEHPDFGKAAIFYINGNVDTFRGAGSLAERFKYLADNGFELGNHTYSHADMNKLDADGIQEEIGKVEEIVQKNLPGYKMRSLSYPKGIRPVEDLRAYGLAGSYNGIDYKYDMAFREGQSGASATPNHVKFDPVNVPRVRASDNEETDLRWSLRNFEAHPEQRYISDGNPNRITVPEKYRENVNIDSRGDKELWFYVID